MTKILTLKTVFLVIIVIPFLFSCSNHDGCNFNEALNYDNEVNIDDGSCIFTEFTFYADTVYLNGMFITEIDVKIGEAEIGTFNGMESSESACSGLNTVSYTPSTVESISWTSEIHLMDSIQDTVIFNFGEERTSPNIECLEINVLP